MMFLLALLAATALAVPLRDCGVSDIKKMSTARDISCNFGGDVKYGNIKSHALCKAYSGHVGIPYDHKDEPEKFAHCAHQGAPQNRVNPVQPHLTGGNLTFRVCVPCDCRQAYDGDCPTPPPTDKPSAAPAPITNKPSTPPAPITAKPSAPPAPVTAKPTDAPEVTPEITDPADCAKNHKEGKRCTLHKTREACITHYNVKADGETKLDQICGWSVDSSKFNGGDGNNCRSTPSITRMDWNSIADFGACNAALGGGGPTEEMPTAAPTCGECSFFNGDKKGCKNADPATYCVDACGWNKNNEKCEAYYCNSMDGKNNMFKCDKKMKKLADLTCYFDVSDDTCNATNTKVACEAYNDLGGKSKKACKKLGKKFNDCKFNGDTKKCQAAGAIPACGDILNQRACKKADHCLYVKENKSCVGI